MVPWAEEWKSFGCVLLTGLSNLLSDCPKENLLFKKNLILKLFSDFEHKVFRLLSKYLLGRAIKKVINVSKSVFGVKIIFEKNSVIWFLSLNERLSDFWRIFRIVLKNAFQVSIGFWWGKKYFKKIFSPDCFRTLSEKFFKLWQNFIRRRRQKCNVCLQWSVLRKR